MDAPDRHFPDSDPHGKHTGSSAGAGAGGGPGGPGGAGGASPGMGSGAPKNLDPYNPSDEEKTWALVLQLSGLATYVVGAGIGLNVLGPLIIWLIKKDQSAFIDFHGRQALNFQITILIIDVVAIVAAFILFFTIILIPLAFLVVFAAVILHIVLTIVAAVKAREGVLYQIPFSIPFFNTRV